MSFNNTLFLFLDSLLLVIYQALQEIKLDLKEVIANQKINHSKLMRNLQSHMEYKKVSLQWIMWIYCSIVKMNLTTTSQTFWM